MRGEARPAVEHPHPRQVREPVAQPGRERGGAPLDGHDADLAGVARRGCFATEPPAAHLRIGCAATADHAELTEGARRLGAALIELGPQRDG